MLSLSKEVEIIQTQIAKHIYDIQNKIKEILLKREGELEMLLSSLNNEATLKLYLQNHLQNQIIASEKEIKIKD